MTRTNGVEIHENADEASALIIETYDYLRDHNIITRSIDNLPYSCDFECLFSRVRTQLNLSRREVFRLLMNGRKRERNGKLRAPKWRREG